MQKVLLIQYNDPKDDDERNFHGEYSHDVPTELFLLVKKTNLELLGTICHEEQAPFLRRKGC